MNSSATTTKNPESPQGNESFLFRYIWPVKRGENSKFLLMTLLMFCILFIQNIMRAQKDSIINTMIGTETIAFLKFAGVMPGAILMAIVYVKLISRLRGESVFYIIIGAFLAYYALFGFLIFPNHEKVHLSQDLAASLIENYPNFKWFILIFSKWSFSLFYIVAELWPNAAFSLLFWQFTNSVTSVEESKRFYPIFAVLGQTGLVFAGMFLENIKLFSQFAMDHFGYDSSLNIASVQVTITLALILGMIAIFVFWRLNHSIFKGKTIKLSAKKQKMSVTESFAFVMSSCYIRYIAILLLCYGMAINLVEGPWKATASQVYVDTAAYSSFVGGYLKYTGALTILFAILCSNLVRYVGWVIAAITTPIMVFVTGMAFFGISNFEMIIEMLGYGLLNPVTLAVGVGAVQNVLSKSSKYTLFDSTKEMAYVPLDEELKTKGKAAVDVIGIKLGKSLGAFVQMMMFILVPTATYSSISSILMVIFCVICVIWLWAVLKLNKEYNLAVVKNSHK